MIDKIIDGKKIADAIGGRLKLRLKKFPPLVLAVIVVGNNPVSRRYIRAKIEQARLLGIDVRVHEYGEAITEGELKQEIIRLGADISIQGLIVQLPLPRHLDTDRVMTALPKTKDVDALSAHPLVNSPVVEAVREILLMAGQKPKGLTAAVIGAGRLVGRPVANWLAKNGAKVVMVNNIEKERQVLKTVDLIVSGVGKPHIIKPADIKEGVIIIDAATSEDNGQLSGDADPACAQSCLVFTPVPGGVGPITLVKLFENLAILSGR